MLLLLLLLLLAASFWSTVSGSVLSFASMLRALVAIVATVVLISLAAFVTGTVVRRPSYCSCCWHRHVCVGAATAIVATTEESQSSEGGSNAAAVEAVDDGDGTLLSSLTPRPGARIALHNDHNDEVGDVFCCCTIAACWAID
uniref:Secreted protein n=1 Tax=Anopheles darlingi TaxID=43151 RepID=A0A2M4DGF4_ANODA